jgi:lysine 2,3-aminomutase
MSPYYRALLDQLGPDHPLNRTVLPLDNSAPALGELVDPLGEDAHSPCPGLIHTYPDKVLLLVTLDCAVHCQYCTRGRLVNRGQGAVSNDWKLSDEVFQTLEKLTGVRDVLVSGGDPLMLPDDELAGILSKVRNIPHIRTVRMGTKIPVVMPERVTPRLVALLAKHRVWLQLHVVHPDELTEETARAFNTLAEAGVPMVAQTVLLKGINDDADTLAELFYGLLENRVKPYYLFQCDPVLGSSSFRTPVQKGLDLMKALQGRMSGLALPNFCIDAPGGGGKIVVHPDTVLRRDGTDVLLTNYEGKEYRYPDVSE